MNQQGLEFWHYTIKRSRYMALGILFGILMLLWEPAFPYLYVGALAGIMHFATELVFYRVAHNSFLGLYFVFVFPFHTVAKQLYPIQDKSFFAEILLMVMFLAMFFGMRGMLQFLFRSAILFRIESDYNRLHPPIHQPR